MQHSFRTEMKKGKKKNENTEANDKGFWFSAEAMEEPFSHNLLL